MKRTVAGALAALATMLSFVPACASAIDLAGTTTVSCASTDAPMTSCTVITGPSAGGGTMDSECTSHGGKLVDACPTAGVVGCCTTKQSGVTTETCSYTGKITEVKTDCQGLVTTTL